MLRREMPAMEVPKQPITVFKRDDCRVMFIVRGRNGFQRIAHDKERPFSEFFLNVYKQLVTNLPLDEFRFRYQGMTIPPESTPKDLDIDHTAVIYLEVEAGDEFNLYTFYDGYIHDNCDTRMPGAYRYN